MQHCSHSMGLGLVVHCLLQQLWPLQLQGIRWAPGGHAAVLMVHGAQAHRAALLEHQGDLAGRLLTRQQDHLQPWLQRRQLGGRRLVAQVEGRHRPTEATGLAGIVAALWKPMGSQELPEA